MESNNVTSRTKKKLSDNVIWRNFHISDKLQKVLRERYPGWTFEGVGQELHPHPVGALERAVSEELAVREIYRMFPDCSVVDIGGNANRHAAAKRDIHSCNPVLCPEDVLRRHASNMRVDAKYCRRRSIDCDEPVDAYLSIHSLYYLTREEILQHVLKSSKGLLVATVHRFDNLFGGLHFNGDRYESTYQVSYTNKPVVSMRVTGNMTPYEHDPLLWLEQNYFSDGVHAMAWNGYQVGDTWVLKFVQAPLGLDINQPAEMNLFDIFKRDDFEGVVKGVVNPHDAESFKPALEFVGIYGDEVHSLFKFVWIRKTGQERKVLIPKTMIAAVASKMIGVDRNEKALRTCIRHMSSYCSHDKIDIPPDVLVDCKTFGAAYAFIYSLEKEIIAFNNLCSYHMHGRYSALRRVLTLQGIWDDRLARWSALCGVTAFGLYQIRNFSKGFPSVERFNWSKVGWATLALCALGGGAYKWVNSDFVVESDLITDYDHDRSSGDQSCDARAGWPEGLPGYDSDRHLVPMRDRAKVTVPELELEEDKGEFYAVAPTFAQYIPVVPRSSLQNEIVSVRNRATMMVPVENPDIWDQVINFSSDYSYKLPVIYYDELDYDSWNSKFPKGRQGQHNCARQDLELNPIDFKDCYRSTFVKRELTMKGGYEPEEFDPRCIQGTSHRANVILGPFMHKFSNNLHLTWNVGTELCYTAGCTGEDIGGWRDQFGDEDVTIFEVDFTRYDAHQGRGAYVLEKSFYERCGLRVLQDAWFVFKAQSRTRGFTGKGLSYSVPFTRKSGDPNTSCGNSIINAMTAKYAFNKLFKLENYMLVQGDDNLIVVRGKLDNLKKFEIQTSLVKFYLNLGLVVKLKISHEWHEIEFCSSLFWPTNDGFVLGPKIGRRLPKIGFSLHKLTEGQVKGMILGCSKEMRHIPVLREYVKYCLKQLKTVKKEFYSDIDAKYKVRSTLNHEYCADTEIFFKMRYNLDVDDIESSLRDILNDGQSFTTMHSWELLLDLMAVDV